jgi:hypothetical protein
MMRHETNTGTAIDVPDFRDPSLPTSDSRNQDDLEIVGLW